MKEVIIGKNKIINGDCFEIIKQFPDNYVDMIITDPPYFLDKMDNNWKDEELQKTTKKQIIKSLPSGMKFDKEQGRKLYNWYYNLSKELIRIIKPGGVFLSFSSQRLYHRMTCAVEDSGFEIRDSLIWLYTKSQPKSMSIKRFAPEIEELEFLKTPMLKGSYEPIVFGIKPKEGTYLENYKKYKIGLLDTSVKTKNDKFPSNVITTDEIIEEIDNFFLIDKPTKEEKGEYNFHKTVKPKTLIKHLIKLFSLEKSIILDPFVGSGTTLVATKETNRKGIGIEINEEYLEIIKKRLTKK